MSIDTKIKAQIPWIARTLAQRVIDDAMEEIINRGYDSSTSVRCRHCNMPSGMHKADCPVTAAKKLLRYFDKEGVQK